MFFLLRNESSNGILKEIGPQNGGKFWTDEKKQTILNNAFWSKFMYSALGSFFFFMLDNEVVSDGEKFFESFLIL